MDLTFTISSRANDGIEFIKYSPSEYDLKTINFINTNPYSIIRKSRQMGLTTLLGIEVLKKCINEPKYGVVYVVPNASSGGSFLNQIEDYLNENGVYYNIGKHEIILENHSTIRFVCSSSELLGVRYDWVIMDDCFVNEKQVYEIYTSSLLIASRVTMVHTPYPEDHSENLWKNIYFKSSLGYNKFKPFDYLWQDCSRFNKTLQLVRGNIIIDYEDERQCERLTQFGFKLVSPEYHYYLGMYGYDEEQFLTEEFNKYMDDYLSIPS